MKIGIITDETDTPLVGLGTYTLNITKQILLQDKKNEYWLVHRRREKHDIYSMAHEEIIPSGKFPLSIIRNFITLPLKLRKQKFDIVHHTSSIGPFVFRQILPGKKNIQSVLDIIPLLHPELHELPVRIAFKFLLPKAVGNSDHIITCSENSKKDIMRRFGIKPEKITVTYLAPNERFRIISRKIAKENVARRFGIKEPYILYVGALEAKKNIPTLLRAYSILKQKGIRHKLVLAGKRGYGYEAIPAVIKKLSLGKDVVELGQVKNAYFSDDLVMLYNAADAFVFPSVYEGFGMPAAEAMRCGCPVVASNGGSLAEVVADAGKIVDVYDAEGYSSAIMEILENSRTAKELARKGLKNSERFSWKESAKKTIEVYENIF
ncbi:MAG: glycosyltransferase family 1 protein [Candidatus Woesearchaeota archaeon]